MTHWVAVINTNLNGTFYLHQRSCARAMVNQRFGRIINISSVVGQMGVQARQANYSASKGGIIAFTKDARLEMAKFNMHRECDCAREFTSTGNGGMPLPEEICGPDQGKDSLRAFRNRGEENRQSGCFPCRRWGITFTGQELNVNGGYHM